MLAKLNKSPDDLILSDTKEVFTRERGVVSYLRLGTDGETPVIRLGEMNTTIVVDYILSQSDIEQIQNFLENSTTKVEKSAEDSGVISDKDILDSAIEEEESVISISDSKYLYVRYANNYSGVYFKLNPDLITRIIKMLENTKSEMLESK